MADVNNNLVVSLRRLLAAVVLTGFGLQSLGVPSWAVESPGVPARADATASPRLAQAPSAPKSERAPATAAARKSKTGLVEFEAAPFPFDDDYVNPRTGKPFIGTDPSGKRSHRTPSGRVYSEDETYSDSRVLLHIPDGFDLRKPAVIVIFFHGHRATIKRDVLARQRVADQISLSQSNAVLVAPQFAVNASDSAPGGFLEPGLFDAFLNEASEQLALLHGQSGTVRVFDQMPVIIIGYSGGFLPAAWAIHHGNANKRLRGVVLMDALYGELDKFERWILDDRSRFFVSGYLGSTRARNLQLQRTLAERNIPFRMALDGPLQRGSVVFIPGGEGENHTDYVTRAWAPNPISDLLNRLPEYRR
jgi:hypothetical protein